MIMQPWKESPEDDVTKVDPPKDDAINKESPMMIHQVTMMPQRKSHSAPTEDINKDINKHKQLSGHQHQADVHIYTHTVHIEDYDPHTDVLVDNPDHTDEDTKKNKQKSGNHKDETELPPHKKT
jgi:hypothetical protein